MKRTILLVVLLLAVAVNASAEIADSAANGFTYKLVLNLQAPPETVYQRLLAVGNWWSSSHTFSGDAHNMSLDAKPMGCWCEKLPNGGGVRHMQVVMVIPGKMLVMTGGLGPLQSMAATGSMKIGLAPANGGTQLQVTYSVTGYLPAGMNSLAAPVDGVLTEQFTRFKNYVETGNPDAAKKLLSVVGDRSSVVAAFRCRLRIGPEPSTVPANRETDNREPMTVNHREDV